MPAGRKKDGTKHRLVYRRVLPKLLGELHDEQGVTKEEAAARAELSVDAWKTYLAGSSFPEGRLVRVARGLGIEPMGFERALVARCAEDLGLELGTGPDLRLSGEIHEEFIFWRVFGVVLRRLHRERGISQRQAAERARVTKGNWRAYALGHRVPKRIFGRIAQGLEVTAEELETRVVEEALVRVGLGEHPEPGKQVTPRVGELDEELWQPVYRAALSRLLRRLLRDLDLTLNEVVSGSGLCGESWRRYLAGTCFPRKNLEALALGLDISVRDLERELLVMSAELLGLEVVDLGRDERRDDEICDLFVYWRIFPEVVKDLRSSLGLTLKQCEERSGLHSSSWCSYLHGKSLPERSMPKIAQGLGIEVGELERRLVVRALEEVGLSCAVRLLRPGPCWGFGGVLLDDGRLLVADTLRNTLREYTQAGRGRTVSELAAVIPKPRMVQMSPGGVVWLLSDGNFVELDRDLKSRRSYAAWGRRDDSGRLLEGIQQWSLVDDETVVGVAFTSTDVWIVRIALTADSAGTFEVLESIPRMDKLERRFFAEGSPKLATGGGGTFILRLREAHTEVREVGEAETVASYPGGAEVMRETERLVGDWFVGLSVLGLVAVGGEVLVLRRKGREHWMEDFEGRVRSGPVRSHAMRLAAVVGSASCGFLELVGERVGGDLGVGVLWVTPSWDVRGS